jgi:hypothetical protein
MKLLFCPVCGDVRALRRHKDKGWAFCNCKESWGRHTDVNNALVGGDAIAIAINNATLYPAIRYADKDPWFNGWVITLPNLALDHVGYERPESDDS